jgi:hypothetical protein
MRHDFTFLIVDHLNLSDYEGSNKEQSVRLIKCSVCLEPGTFRTRGERVAACASLALQLGLWVGEYEITLTTFYHEFSRISWISMRLSHISKVRTSSHMSFLFVTCWSDVAKHCPFSTMPMLAEKNDVVCIH